MVKNLSPQGHSEVAQAVASVEKETGTKLSVVILPASHSYKEFVMLCGLLVGSIIGLALWQLGLSKSLPALFILQFGCIILFDFFRPLHFFCVSLLPPSILRKHAAHMAFQEYHLHHSNNMSAAPYVMLYVSLTEHYVHVITNPVVHQRIPDNWDSVTVQFANTMKKSSLASATLEAIEGIGQILKK